MEQKTKAKTEVVQVMLTKEQLDEMIEAVTEKVVKETEEKLKNAERPKVVISQAEIEKAVRKVTEEKVKEQTKEIPEETSKEEPNLEASKVEIEEEVKEKIQWRKVGKNFLIGLGLVGVGAGGVTLYNHHKNNKKEKEETLVGENTTHWEEF